MVPRFGTSFGGQAAYTFGPRTWVSRTHRFFGRFHKTVLRPRYLFCLFAQVSPTTANLRAYEFYKGRGIDLVKEHLTIFRWTTNNPGDEVKSTVKQFPTP